MSDLRPLPYRKVVKILSKLDFVKVRSTGGSHEVWQHISTQKECTVPHHKEIQRGTLRSIIKQAGLTEKEFLSAK